MPKSYLNPPTLFPSQQYGFSQIVTTTGGVTVYISGQVGWDAQQTIVDPGDLAGQSRRALENLETAVKAAGGRREDIVTLRIYIVGDHIHDGKSIQAALLDFFDPQRLPTSTWVGVHALASADFLVEIEAVAVIE